MAEWVIGDIHGHFDAFEALLERITSVYGDPEHLVLLGDLVDRGPDSRAVVERVRGMHSAGRATVLLGNHDEMMLHNLLLNRPELAAGAGLPEEAVRELTAGLAHAPQQTLRLWMMNGGYTTIRSYGGDPWMPSTWNIPEAHLAFLLQCPLAWDGGAYYASHARAGKGALEAGIAAGASPWAVSEPLRHELLWSRETPADQPALPHYSGHTPQEQVQREGQQILMDTGCAYGELLTAIAPQEGWTLQVPCGRVRT